MGDDKLDQKVLVAFAKYEIKMKEYERARVIFKYGLDRLPKSKSQSLYNQYTNFEKQYGNREGIEDVVLGKRRVQYEEEIEANPKNYDVWFDYAKLEESAGEIVRVREVYERAIAQVPPANEKRFWRRYIYLWINYALYEELETEVWYQGKTFKQDTHVFFYRILSVRVKSTLNVSSLFHTKLSHSPRSGY